MAHSVPVAALRFLLQRSLQNASPYDANCAQRHIDALDELETIEPLAAVPAPILNVDAVKPGDVQPGTKPAEDAKK